MERSGPFDGGETVERCGKKCVYVVSCTSLVLMTCLEAGPRLPTSKARSSTSRSPDDLDARMDDCICHTRYFNVVVDVLRCLTAHPFRSSRFLDVGRGTANPSSYLQMT